MQGWSDLRSINMNPSGKRSTGAGAPAVRGNSSAGLGSLGRLGQLGLAAVVCLTGVSGAMAQIIVRPPPAVIYEPAPAPRMGYVWQRGFWAWQYGRQVWVRGHWVMAGPPVYLAPRLERAPAPAPRVERVSADALFPFDRAGLADILPAGRADVGQIAARLLSSQFQRVEVRGYTDRLGSDAYNLNLSQRRADAVKALLIQQGIPAGKITARGLGKQDPISQCADGQSQALLVACLQPDRRVEILTYARPDNAQPDEGQDGYGRPDDGRPAYAPRGYRGPGYVQPGEGGVPSSDPSNGEPNDEGQQ
jgi:OOP family OmpA-OmpF porin